MAKLRISTHDGHVVGIGDRVWTENHLPWVVVGPFDQLGYPWVALSAAHEESDLDHEMSVPLEETQRLLYRLHPPGAPSLPLGGDCHWAGCRHRPWGELRSRN